MNTEHIQPNNRKLPDKTTMELVLHIICKLFKLVKNDELGRKSESYAHLY